MSCGCGKKKGTIPLMGIDSHQLLEAEQYDCGYRSGKLYGGDVNDTSSDYPL